MTRLGVFSPWALGGLRGDQGLLLPSGHVPEPFPSIMALLVDPRVSSQDSGQFDTVLAGKRVWKLLWEASGTPWPFLPVS